MMTAFFLGLWPHISFPRVLDILLRALSMTGRQLVITGVLLKFIGALWLVCAISRIDLETRRRILLDHADTGTFDSVLDASLQHATHFRDRLLRLDALYKNRPLLPGHGRIRSLLHDWDDFVSDLTVGRDSEVRLLVDEVADMV